MNQKKNQMNKLYKFCALLLSLAVAVFCVAVSTVTVKANDSGPTASVSSVTGTLAGYGCTDGGEYLTTYTVGGMEVSGIIELGVESVDDSLIDSSNAVVELINGPVGLNFSYNYQDFANSIAAGWDYGKNSFTVSEIAFTWNNVEDHSDPGFYEDRQWSIFGGDGSGHYTFTLQVSGITYNGSPVLGATFEVEVYIFSLAATIQQAETLTESNYTASSWSALQTALAAAKTVAANTNATLAQMYEATVALNTAIISLVSAADTTALTTEIGKAEALTESDYTASSWSALQTALAAVKTVAADSEATQADVDAAADVLSAAIASLVSAADTTALTAAIVEAEALTESDYTASSWSALQTALAAAKTVATDSEATQADVDAAADDLNIAIASLVNGADITALTAAIGSAEALTESDYTASSWSALQTALAAAKTMAADSEVMQKDVDAATDALSVAIASLVKAASTGDTEDKTENTEDTTGDIEDETGDTEDTTGNIEDTIENTEDSAGDSVAVYVSPAQTDDDTAIVLWFVALAVAIAVVIVLGKYRRKAL